MVSPSISAVMSMTAKSPFFSLRVVSFSSPKRARRLSSSAFTASSSTLSASTLTEMAEKSGTVISGRMSTSAVNCTSSLSSILVMSICGWPSGLSSFSVIARS